MNPELFVCGLAFLIGGGISVFWSDLAWTLQEFVNGTWGVVSERSEGWETRNTCGSMLMMALGFGLMLYSFAAPA